MGESVRVPLRNKRGETTAYAIVDMADFRLASQVKWCLHREGYARGRLKGKDVKLHRFLLGLVDPMVDVDHINRDRLDCRRSNMRTCTRAENHQNRGSNPGTSKYRGVSFDPERGKWKAQATLNYANYFLGRFGSEEEAARVASEWRAEHMPFSADASA